MSTHSEERGMPPSSRMWPKLAGFKMSIKLKERRRLSSRDQDGVRKRNAT